MHLKSSVRFPVIGGAILASLFLLGPVRASGQEAPPQDKGQQGSMTPAGYSEIVVTAPRMGVPYKEAPGATSVVGEDTLEAMPKAISPGEALALVPGVKVDTQYDSEKSHISIRGQGILTERGIRGIQVLLDGIPLNDPSGFAPDLYDVDWSTVQRIEVIRGPSGAFYGGGSSAGVINIITKDGRSDPNAADVMAEGGTNRFWKALSEFGGTTTSTDYRVSASRSMGDGNRDHSAFFSTNLYGKFRFVVTPSFQLSAVIMGTSYFNENPEGLNAQQVRENPNQANPDSARQNEFAQTRRFTAGIVGTAKLASNQDLNFTVYGRNTDFVESVPATVQHRTLKNPGAMLQYTFHSGTGPVKNHFSLGTDASWQDIDEYRRPNLGHAVEGPTKVSDETISQHGYGVYALDRIEFGPQWAATLNLRHDSIRNELNDRLKLGGVDLSGAREFNKTTGRVGLTWNPRPDFGVYATWGQGFMPPATEEMLANPIHQGGFNTTIQPATSVGEELGIRGTLIGKVSYDVAGFYLHTNDDFERYRVPSRPLETFYGNAGDTRRYGLETAFGWFPVESLAVRLAYTYNHFTYTQISSKVFPTAAPGNWLPNSPAHQAYLDVQYTPVTHWILGLSGEVQSRNYVDPTNIPATGGYTLVHARVAYQWQAVHSRGEVMLSLRNAFAKKYIAFTEPDPDGNSYQPGPGREVFMGVHFWFGKK